MSDPGVLPDLATFFPGRPGPVIVVDGATPPGCAAVARSFADAVVVTHDPRVGRGLPNRQDDEASLDVPDGGVNLLVLVDVLDRVLEPGPALRHAASQLAPGGGLLLVQEIAPDEVALRAVWNALSRLRDGRHTSTLTRRQLKAVLSGVALDEFRDTTWVEMVDPEVHGRPEVDGSRELFVAALRSRPGLLEGGRLPVLRVAIGLNARP